MTQIHSNATDTGEDVTIKRSGASVTWLFHNEQNEPVEFDMSFIRADTISALLKRSVNLGRGDQMTPRLLKGTQTELYVYPDHYTIVFDQNPKLRLLRRPEQISDLIKNLEDVAA
jgi:hypothetical protein